MTTKKPAPVAIKKFDQLPELPCPYGKEWLLVQRHFPLVEEEIAMLQATTERNVQLVLALTLMGMEIRHRQQEQLAEAMMDFGYAVREFCGSLQIEEDGTFATLVIENEPFTGIAFYDLEDDDFEKVICIPFNDRCSVIGMIAMGFAIRQFLFTPEIQQLSFWHKLLNWLGF
jgi:hypothetical protein